MAKSSKSNKKADTRLEKFDFKVSDKFHDYKWLKEQSLISPFSPPKEVKNKGAEKLKKAIPESQLPDPVIQEIINKHTNKETLQKSDNQATAQKQEPYLFLYFLLAGVIITVVVVAVPFTTLLEGAWMVIRYFLIWGLIAGLAVGLFNRR